MKKDLIDTIMEKEFHALTDVEREEMASYCTTEEEYNQMKEVFVGMEQMTWDHPQPKAETKQRLDDLFDSTYPKAAPVWYSSALALVVPKEKPVYRQPLVQIAAIAIIALLLVPFWNSNSDMVDPIQAPQELAQAETPKVDKAPEVVPEPVNVIEQDDPIFKADGGSDANDPTILLASAEPVAADPAAGSSGAGGTHPDGVFIAVSQPASESPEMFDLLTATF